MCFSIFTGPLNSARDLRKKTSALKFLFSAIQMEAKCHRLDCQSMENYNKATMVLTLMGKLGLRLLLSFLFILFLQQLLYYYYWSNMDMFEEYEFDFIIILVGNARSKIQKIFFVILIARTYICHTVTVFLQGQHYRKSHAFEFKILSLASLFAASFPADMV